MKCPKYFSRSVTRSGKQLSSKLKDGRDLKSTLPPIQPHTQAKHHILEYHLKEWFPILGSAHPVLRYIDGFAGPGEYAGGEPGSPIISLLTVLEHRGFASFEANGGRMEFLFVDRNPEFYQHLKRRITQRYWPRAFQIEVKRGEFEAVLTALLDDAEAPNQSIPPTLLFIDPFGSAGFPMELLERLVSLDRLDILINLNILEFVQWILPDATKHITADRLYGSGRWRPALGLTGRSRADFLVAEYETALQEIAWQGTSFEMVNSQNQTVYHLVFATQSHKGLEAIKRAMRNASQTGEFRYTDRIDAAQPMLEGLDMETQFARDIAEYLFVKYEGQEVAIDVLMKDEINWHRWWLPSDLRDALKYLEYNETPRIRSVRNDDGRTRRRNSYPEGCHITFGSPPQARLL